MKETHYLAKRMALNLGLLSIGAAMAWAVALILLQDAAIAAGVLPEPGTVVTKDRMYSSSPLWQAAKTLQHLANSAGIIGAVFLLAYGVADQYNLQEVRQ